MVLYELENQKRKDMCGETPQQEKSQPPERGVGVKRSATGDTTEAKYATKGDLAKTKTNMIRRIFNNFHRWEEISRDKTQFVEVYDVDDATTLLQQTFSSIFSDSPVDRSH